jgi:hypothetical protein
VTDAHPTPGDLVDLHFGEGDGRRRKTIAAHVQGCRHCREELGSVESLDRALATLPEEAPPALGLEWVLSRIEQEKPLRGRTGGWLVPLATGLAGVGGGATAIYGLGTWLLALRPFAQWSVVEPARVASGFGLAALVFFAVGSFVTLALAPALLIEAQTRGRAAAGR